MAPIFISLFRNQNLRKQIFVHYLHEKSIPWKPYKNTLNIAITFFWPIGKPQKRSIPSLDLKNFNVYVFLFFFSEGNMSTENPWKVDNIKAFSFLNCPECSFKIKDENSLQNHPVKNHPLSSVLFDGKLVKEGIIHILRKHLYGTTFNFITQFFIKLGFFRQNKRVYFSTLRFDKIFMGTLKCVCSYLSRDIRTNQLELSS